jgi:hypothetical protein
MKVFTLSDGRLVAVEHDRWSRELLSAEEALELHDKLHAVLGKLRSQLSSPADKPDLAKRSTVIRNP